MKLTRVKNVRELIKKTAPELYDEVMEGVAKKTFSMMLIRMRVNAGMMQRDMAQALGLSQSRISKLEMSDNDHIGIQHLIDYGRITGFGSMEGNPSGKEVVLKFSLA